MSDPRNEIDNISMFDIIEDGTEKHLSPTKIDVVKLNYENAESLTWQELFSGYNNLHAITFSSGINFVYKLLEMMP